MNRTQFQRGLMFVSALVVLFLIPWAYVCARVGIGKMSLDEIGSPLFLIYTFFDFYLTFYYFIKILLLGAEANLVDTQIKKILMSISRECSQASIYSKNEMVYKIKKYKTE